MVSKITGISLLVSCSLYTSLKAIENDLRCSPSLYEKISNPHLAQIASNRSYCENAIPNWILLSVAFAAISLAYCATGRRS
jgi:hypothetical protein